MDTRIEAYMKQIPVLAEAAAGKEVFWVNGRECPESRQGKKQCLRSRYRMRQGGWNDLRLIWPRCFLRRLHVMA